LYFVLVLVLVADEQDSFSAAVDARIFPELVWTMLERRPINCRCIDDMLSQVVQSSRWQLC